MDEPCRIRAATSADLEAVLRIERVSFSDPWPKAAFQHHLTDVFLVAEEGPSVLGYLIAWHVGPDAEILNVAVAPEARRGGVGRRLVAGALELLGGGGIRSAFLEVRESNGAARRLYGSLGFAEVGRRRGYYQAPREDALILRWERAGEAG
jgi:ribosomal-protein-alanine N-acetyltransferase